MDGIYGANSTPATTINLGDACSAATATPSTWHDVNNITTSDLRLTDITSVITRSSCVQSKSNKYLHLSAGKNKQCVCVCVFGLLCGLAQTPSLNFARNVPSRWQKSCSYSALIYAQLLVWVLRFRQCLWIHSAISRVSDSKTAGTLIIIIRRTHGLATRTTVGKQSFTHDADLSKYDTLRVVRAKLTCALVVLSIAYNIWSFTISPFPVPTIGVRAFSAGQNSHRHKSRAKNA